MTSPGPNRPPVNAGRTGAEVEAMAHPSPPAGTDPRPIRWDSWFLAIGIPYGLLLIVFLPPQLTPDAAVHLVRIDEIARGEIVAPLRPDHRAVEVPDSCLGMMAASMVNETLTSHTRVSERFHSPGCGPPRPIDISNTALNGPVAYLPQVVGYVAGRELAGLLVGVWAARLAGLAAYLALCWLALRIAPNGQPLLFVVALLPTSMALASSLSADPMAISLGLLAVAILLRLRVDPPAVGEVRKTHQLLWALAVCLVLLAVAKNLYWVAALLVILVPAGRFATRRGRRSYVAAVLAAAALPTALWSILVVNRVRLRYVALYLTDSTLQRAWIGHHPLGFLRIAARSIFGTNVLASHTVSGMVAQVSGPAGRATAPFGLASFGLLVLILALVVDRGSRRSERAAVEAVAPGAGGGLEAGPADRVDRVARLAVPAIVLGVVMMLVLYGEALTVTPALWTDPDISEIEGRFFLPILSLLLLIPGSVPGTGARGRSTTQWVWAVPVGVLLLAAWFAVLLGLQYY